jgi:pyrroline-5-carboxylate reductase
MDNENEIKRVKDMENSKASRFKGMTTDMKKNNDSEDKNKILSSKMSKFGKGFKIPDDKTDKLHKRKRNDV